MGKILRIFTYGGIWNFLFSKIRMVLIYSGKNCLHFAQKYYTPPFQNKRVYSMYLVHQSTYCVKIIAAIILHCVFTIQRKVFFCTFKPALIQQKTCKIIIVLSVHQTRSFNPNMGRTLIDFFKLVVFETQIKSFAIIKVPVHGNSTTKICIFQLRSTQKMIYDDHLRLTAWKIRTVEYLTKEWNDGMLRP